MPKVKSKPSAPSEARSSKQGLAKGSTHHHEEKQLKGWEMTAQEALRINYVDQEISSKS